VGFFYLRFNLKADLDRLPISSNFVKIIFKMKPPKKWKMAVLIWLAIYPLVTLIFAFGSDLLLSINPLPLRTLIITIVVVPIMVFIFIPLLQKLLKSWLTK
jgi:antibiotic biosynthesis monooxygenase (ABM) superfamily enzyme